MGKLLDLLNGEPIPDQWIGDDREVLVAYISALRRRTDAVRPAARFSVRRLSDGKATVLEDDKPMAVGTNGAASRTLFPGGAVTFDPTAEGSHGRDRRGKFPSEYARQLADSLRERNPLPMWPEDTAFLSANAISSAAQQQVAAWKAEWATLRHAGLCRCRQPACDAPGGRLFIPRKSQRDCDACRAIPKATRWRHARKR